MRTYSESATRPTHAVSILTPNMEAINTVDGDLGFTAFLTFDRFRDMCNIMKEADNKTYKKKKGLLYYLVRDDFYNGFTNVIY